MLLKDTQLGSRRNYGNCRDAKHEDQIQSSQQCCQPLLQTELLRQVKAISVVTFLLILRHKLLVGHCGKRDAKAAPTS